MWHLALLAVAAFAQLLPGPQCGELAAGCEPPPPPPGPLPPAPPPPPGTKRPHLVFIVAVSRKPYPPVHPSTHPPIHPYARPCIRPSADPPRPPARPLLPRPSAHLRTHRLHSPTHHRYCASPLTFTTARDHRDVQDDLGWNDVGFHTLDGRGQIPTPHLAALASTGVRLTNYCNDIVTSQFIRQPASLTPSWGPTGIASSVSANVLCPTIRPSTPARTGLAQSLALPCGRPRSRARRPARVLPDAELLSVGQTRHPHRNLHPLRPRHRRRALPDIHPAARVPG